MRKSNPVLNAAIAGVLAAVAGSLSAAAHADDEHKGDQQCAGVVKAGQNDCATSMNDCHGHATSDSYPMVWVDVPKGTCEKIAGAHLVHVKVPAPKPS